jgi:streptomycin 6-kinase
LSIPEGLVHTTLELYGERGREWLARLPAIIAGLEAHWSLTVGPPFDELSYNYVAPAVGAHGASLVLKLGVPNPELLTEMEALRLFKGRGAVRLVAHDREAGALLLERLQPGTPLAELEDDEQATSIAAGVMRRLWRPAPAEHPFPTVASWAAGLCQLRKEFDGGSGPFPEALVERAEGLFAELIGSMAHPVLLHGDLHHWNIVAAGREPWLAIDPKGLVGEPAYEVGALLRNRLPESLAPDEIRRLTARRVDQLAEALGFDRGRMLGWALAQAVLSAWWSYEDHGRFWDQALACAEALAGLV